MNEFVDQARKKIVVAYRQSDCHSIGNQCEFDPRFPSRSIELLAYIMIGDATSFVHTILSRKMGEHKERRRDRAAP